MDNAPCVGEKHGSLPACRDLLCILQNFARGAGCISRSDGIVHFLLPGFPVTPPRNHNHPQLGDSTPADGGVKSLPWLGYIGPHGGLAGA